MPYISRTNMKNMLGIIIIIRSVLLDANYYFTRKRTNKLDFDVDVRTCSVLCVEISLTITPSHRAGSMILAKAITFFLVESIPVHSEKAKKIRNELLLHINNNNYLLLI